VALKGENEKSGCKRGKSITMIDLAFYWPAMRSAGLRDEWKARPFGVAI